MKAGEDRTFIVKDIRAFIRCVLRGEPHTLTPRFSYDPETHVVSQEDLAVLQALRTAADNEAFYHSINGYPGYAGRFTGFVVGPGPPGA